MEYRTLGSSGAQGFDAVPGRHDLRRARREVDDARHRRRRVDGVRHDRSRARRGRELHRHRRRLRQRRALGARPRALVRQVGAGATTWCSPPSSASRCGTGRTARARRATASCAPSRIRSGASRPIASTSIRSTCRTSTRPRRRRCARSTISCAPARSLYLGCSNYAAYRLTDSLWLSRSLGLERFVALQAQYSLVVRELEREHVPLVRQVRARHPALVAAGVGLPERQVQEGRAAAGRLAPRQVEGFARALRYGAQLEDPRRRRGDRQGARHLDDARWRCAGWCRSPRSPPSSWACATSGSSTTT